MRRLWKVPMEMFVLPIVILVPACGGGAADSAAADDATPEQAGPAPGTPEFKIQQALSASPEALAQAAAVMDWPATEGGQFTELRAGTNGWACFPNTPANTGASGNDAMCLDKEFQTWAAAWTSKTAPKLTGVGFGYMLHGDIGASATDPFATAATADNQWVVSGPHVMVVVPDPKQLDGLPGDANSGGPWVMWKGTPYAHVMMPVATPGAAH
ncbi:MAG: hypothetical protein ACREMQ_19475 [Longimicrobiales bacterium]